MSANLAEIFLWILLGFLSLVILRLIYRVEALENLEKKRRTIREKEPEEKP